MRAPSLIIGLLILTLLGCGDKGPQPPSIADISSMLQSDDANAQREGCGWVRRLGPQAAETVPGLIVALRSDDRTVRELAAVVLREVGPKAMEAIPALTAALSDPEPSVREAAAMTLGNLGPAASAAIPALEQLSDQPGGCGSAKAALQKIRP